MPDLVPLCCQVVGSCPPLPWLYISVCDRPLWVLGSHLSVPLSNSAMAMKEMSGERNERKTPHLSRLSHSWWRWLSTACLYIASVPFLITVNNVGCVGVICSNYCRWREECQPNLPFHCPHTPRTSFALPILLVRLDGLNNCCKFALQTSQDEGYHR